MAILLLNTLESRQVKKEKVATITKEKEGVIVEVDYNNKLDSDTCVCRVVGYLPIKYIDPFADSYQVRLTKEEHDAYIKDGVVTIERATGTYLLKDGVMTIANNYNVALVR